MAVFFIHLMGQGQPIKLDMLCADIDELADEASRARFLAGHMAEPDEEGICRRVLIAAQRIQCVIEAD